MITIDTSVAVPFLASWHERHAFTRKALLGRELRLGAHVGMETFSVLSRLPGSRRISAPDAWTLLQSAFRAPWLGLPAAGARRLIERLAKAGIGGGAVYDGLVGATAVHHGARLLTFDRRALPVYDKVGADIELLAHSKGGGGGGGG